MSNNVWLLCLWCAIKITAQNIRCNSMGGAGKNKGGESGKNLIIVVVRTQEFRD